jgi:hypothetical protein
LRLAPLGLARPRGGCRSQPAEGAREEAAALGEEQQQQEEAEVETERQTEREAGRTSTTQKPHRSLPAQAAAPEKEEEECQEETPTAARVAGRDAAMGTWRAQLDPRPDLAAGARSSQGGPRTRREGLRESWRGRSW